MVSAEGFQFRAQGAGFSAKYVLTLSAWQYLTGEALFDLIPPMDGIQHGVDRHPHVPPALLQQVGFGFTVSGLGSRV